MFWGKTEASYKGMWASGHKQIINSWSFRESLECFCISAVTCKNTSKRCLRFCFFSPKEVRKVFFPGFESAHCGTREMGEAARASATQEGVWADCLIFLLFRSYFSTTQKEEKNWAKRRFETNIGLSYVCVWASVCDPVSPANKYIVSACINCFHNHLKYKSFACPETDLMSRREGRKIREEKGEEISRNPDNADSVRTGAGKEWRVLAPKPHQIRCRLAPFGSCTFYRWRTFSKWL